MKCSNVRRLLSAVVLSMAAWCQPSSQTNFVFILADDLGWTDLRCYGSDLNETPALDRMAKEGVRFTDAYAACPVCSPTRASIMTGKYPARLHLTNYLPGNHPTPYSKLLGVKPVQHLPLEEQTIAETLKKAGYTSGIVGKWHLGGKGFAPNLQGFDHSFSFAGGAVPGFFYPAWRGGIDPPAEGKEGDYITDRLTEEAIAFLRTNQSKPFFLYLAHFAPHLPIQAREATIEKYRRKLRPGLRHQNPIYAAMIDSLDESVSRVLKTLDELRTRDAGYVWNAARRFSVLASCRGVSKGVRRDHLLWHGYATRKGVGLSPDAIQFYDRGSDLVLARSETGNVPPQRLE